MASAIPAKLIEDAGAKPAFKGYHGFPCVLCTSLNEQVVHGIPSKRALKEGDIIGLDLGAIVGGLALGLFQQAANFLVGGIFSSVAVFTLFIVVLLAAPQGLFGASTARRV